MASPRSRMQVGRLAQDLAALLRAEGAPDGPRASGCIQRRIQVAGIGQRQLAQDFFRCGVHHRHGAAAFAAQPLAIDEQVKFRVRHHFAVLKYRPESGRS